MIVSRKNNYVAMTTLITTHVDALATGIQAPAGPCKLMNIAIRTNCIKYQMLHVFAIGRTVPTEYL